MVDYLYGARFEQTTRRAFTVVDAPRHSKPSREDASLLLNLINTQPEPWPIKSLPAVALHGIREFDHK